MLFEMCLIFVKTLEMQKEDVKNKKQRRRERRCEAGYENKDAKQDAKNKEVKEEEKQDGRYDNKHETRYEEKHVTIIQLTRRRRSMISTFCVRYVLIALLSSASELLLLLSIRELLREAGAEREGELTLAPARNS
jgi:hypothetical protein